MTFRFELLNNPRDAELFLRHWTDGRFRRLGVDIETAGENGLDPYKSSIRLVSLSDGGRNCVIDVWACGLPDALKWILTYPGIQKFAHNAQFEYINFYQQWKIEAKNLWCTMLLEQITRNGLEYTFNLKDTVNRRLGYVMGKELQSSDWNQPNLSEEQLLYSALDAYVLPFLAEKQTRDVELLKLGNIVNLEMEMIPIWAKMRLRGIRFEENRVTDLAKTFEREMSDLLRQIQESLPKIPLPKKYFTPKGNLTGKAKQLYPSGYKSPETPEEFKTALEIAGVKLPEVVDKVTKESRTSLSKETYGKIEHPCGLLLEEYNSKKTIYGTFLKPVKDKWIHPKTGRVHGQFNQCGTVTGRISMSEPNLMNLPREEKRYRNVVIPAEGYTWLSLDYSQIELRVLAEKCNETNWIRMFMEGEDLHQNTKNNIDKMLGRQHPKVDRQLSKNVNFGCGYDQTAPGLQLYLWKKIKVWFELDMCRAFIKAYFEGGPNIKRYHNQIHDETLRHWETGYSIRTMAGRIRSWPAQGLRKRSYTRDDGTVRDWVICSDAINMPIQGTVGDIIKLAMFRMDFWIRSQRLEDLVIMVLQIHDEVAFEVHNSLNINVIAAKFEQIMVDSAKTLIKKCPIVVEAKAGPSWGECKKIEFYAKTA